MQRIAFLLFPEFQVMILAAASVFEFANLEVKEPIYEMLLSLGDRWESHELARLAGRNSGV